MWQLLDYQQQMQGLTEGQDAASRCFCGTALARTGTAIAWLQVQALETALDKQQLCK
jgi:hypothetical protein